jgi:hypothetical protein
MYGMVNKAIEDLVHTHYGEETWGLIKERADVDVDVFIGNDAYPDDVTYKLVTAASEVSGSPPEDILFAFGEHWVLKTARDEYGDLLQAGGKTLREFLINLPNFHARIMLIFPNLQPPTFSVSEVTDDSLRLHYMTHRGGLAAFVMGIVSGLGQFYGTPVKVTHEESKDKGAEHDVFLITWSDIGKGDVTP